MLFFSFSFKSVSLLFFFLHGMVFSFLLLIKGVQKESKPSLWLALFTFLCALYISPFMLGYAGWYSVLPYRGILFYLPLQHLFLLGPVLYVYFSILLDNSFRFSKKDLLHFVPSFAYLLYTVTLFLLDRFYFGEQHFYADGKDKDLLPFYHVLGLISWSYYLYRCLQLYRQYKKLTYDRLSFADAMMFRWAERVLLAFMVLISVRVLFFFINPEWDAFGKKYWYYLTFSGLFYYISISGYANSVQSMTFFSQPPINTIPFFNTIDVVDVEETDSLDKKEIDDFGAWKEKIEQLMVEQLLYEDPTLTISAISNKLGLPIKKASQVINQGFHMNFNDFVNQYRVNAVIQKLKEGEHNMQTLLSLAYESGFNSKSTFNRAFKRVTSQNPKNFIETQLSK